MTLDWLNITIAQTAAAATDTSPNTGPVAEILSGYVGVFVVAFLVTLLATPIMRHLAINNGVVDNPDARKVHRIPVAYLGGVAVFLGLLAGVAFSYVGKMFLPSEVYSVHESIHGQRDVPFSIILGMTLIMLTGLIDDVVGLMPRLKVAGQLLAAAALAMENVGTNLARGVMRPIGEFVGNPDLTWMIELPAMLQPVLGSSIKIDIIYWVGTAMIAVFVLGACNASNLIDGLDGLLTGVTAIAALCILIIAVNLAMLDFGGTAADHESLDATRIIVSLCLLGACLGFLPHNFNPASIFLGDCGSLLMGYVTIVLVLDLRDVELDNVSTTPENA